MRISSVCIRLLLLATGLGMTACYAAAAAAVELPRQVNVIVPYAPGGAVDVLTRLLVKQMATDTGTNFVVENKPGAAGAIAAAQVARARPDGHTVLMGTTNTHGINSRINASLQYDPVADFKAIADVAENIVILAANKDFPATTLEQAIALMKQSPGKYSYGSPGIGSVHQLAMEQLKDKLGLDIVHVAYKGAGPAMADTVAGNIPLVMAGIAPALPFLQDKRIKILGIANPKGDMYAGVREIAGVQYFSDIRPDAAVHSWIGMFAPAGTDDALVNALHDAIQKVLKSQRFVDALAPLGMVPNPATREAFDRKVRQNVSFWEQAIASPDRKTDQ